MRIVKLFCVLMLVLATILNAQKWQKIEMKFSQSDSSVRAADITFATKNTGWISIYGPELTNPTPHYFTKIFKTTNGGHDWFVQKYIINDSDNLKFFATDSLHCWANNIDGRLLYTIDGGTNWEETYIAGKPTVYPYMFRNLYFFNNGEGIVLEEPSRPWFTNDGGKSWTAGDSSKVRFYGGGISFINREKGWLVSASTPYRSDGGYIANTTDGGKTWMYQDSATHMLFGVDFVDSLHGFAAGTNFNYSSGSILTTSDGGNNWQVRQILYSGAFYDIGFLDNKNGWITGNGKILKTTDGGITWETQFIDSASYFHELILLKKEKKAYIFGEDYLYGPPFTLFYANLGDITNAEENKGNLPKEFKLMQNYPNPFNPSTNINYSIPEDGKVVVKVFDVLGRELTTLVNDIVSAGKHSVLWNGNNFASGIYFYSVTFKNQTLYKKMLLVK